MDRKVEFDIAFSFAGEDREYVEQVYMLLNKKGVSVFYDYAEEANLWGKNLYDYLSDVYRNKALYTVMFISEHYRKKLWTNHEREAMQSRAFQESREYILPARFDETDIPGLLPTVGYISLINKSPAEFSELILRKLVLSGRTIPSEQVRRSLSSLVRVPKISSSLFAVNLRNEKGEPVSNASVILIAENNTVLQPTSNGMGVVTFEINIRRNYTLYFAHENYPAMIKDGIDPQDDLEVIVYSSENIGSVICIGTGYIPGLRGRLNPILDTSFRRYLYADNIAINDGKQQPVSFSIDEPLDLEDSLGIIMQVTVRDIKGSTSLIEYVKPIIEDD
ncbi:TIR domain-containing protein [Sphingobacterium siyangense]|uniref:toll/interleukin-1 receptor domain-containing protein n=1 Tax=Sphingobacterium siyangense TaxID=459529 RepID=UPI003DA63B48